MPTNNNGTYYFTAGEISELQGYFDASDWATAYNRIAEMLDSIPSEPDVITQVKLWFEGAHLVNTGDGAFSDLIRYYTQRQGQLHFGSSVGTGDFSPYGTKMQEASDDVARRALTSILTNNAGRQYRVPLLSEIAVDDAAAVGETLFFSDQVDTAYTNNAAWSGTTLFSLLGSDQTSLLTMSRSRQNDGLNTIEDLRNLIFAVDAFDYALEQARISFSGGDTGFETFLERGILWQGLINAVTGAYTGDYEDLLLTGVTGHSAESDLRFVVKQDRYQLVDKLADLMGISLSSTTESNFLNNTHTVFSTVENNSHLELNLAPLQDRSSSEMASMAKADTVEGRAYRYALLNLNPFVITGDDSIYNPHNTNGELNIENFSDQYLQDRTQFLKRVIHFNTIDTDGSQPPFYSGSQGSYTNAFNNPYAGDGLYYEDKATGKIINQTASNDPRYAQIQRIFFGESGSDALSGGDGSDRLYGSDGTDTLIGAAGSDYLEGGNDNDILTGGQDNDTLSGGTGADTYRFNPGDGLDHITDAVNDNNDAILINADAGAINLSSYQFHILDGAAGDAGLYQAKHTNPNAPRVTALFNGNGSSLTIDINGGSAAGGNTIVVDHFVSGNFNVVLGGPETIEAPDAEPGSYTVTAVDINRVGLSLSEFVDATYALRAARNEQAGVNSTPILLDAESVTWTHDTSYAEAASPSHSGAAGIYFDGGNANDQLIGGDRADEYDGWSGGDYIELRGGDDLASGGQGSDTLLGGDGDDMLMGGEGNSIHQNVIVANFNQCGKVGQKLPRAA